MNFIEYIEYLSRKHVEVHHEVNDEQHFLSSEREKHTAMVDNLCYPAVIVDKSPGFSFTGQPGAYFKQCEYPLFVLEHVSDTSDYAQINSALQKSEGILCDFLNRIMEDKNNPMFRFLKPFRLEEVEVQYIQNSDMQQYGVMALITLDESYRAKNCINVFMD